MIDLIRQNISYGETIPVSPHKQEIIDYGTSIRKVSNYNDGDSIKDLIFKYGGNIHFVDGFNRFGMPRTVIIHATCDFDICLSRYTSSSKDNFELIRCLGHYIIHSSCGSRPLLINKPCSHLVEWQANWFAIGFLMPELKLKEDYITNRGRLDLVALLYKLPLDIVKIRAESLQLDWFYII